MIVVDCSVVVDALAGVDAADLAGMLGDHRLVAPHVIDVEVVSVVRQLVLAGRLTSLRGGELLDDFDRLPLTRWSSAHDLRRRAYSLRDNFSAYDAAYVVLAESLECPLATRDRRLAAAARRHTPVTIA